MIRRTAALTLAPCLCVIGACATHHAPPAKPAAATAPSSETSPACELREGGRVTLRLVPPAGAQCSGGDGALHLRRGRRAADVWPVPGAAGVDDAVATLPALVASEFIEFRPGTPERTAVAGAPALRVRGPGREADDHDPGTADAVVFTTGGRVFAAVIHGESLSDQDHAWLTEVVAGVRRP